MSYIVRILKRAQRELADLPHRDYARITDTIGSLSTDPRPHGASKLTARDGWRMRVGDYRVIYEIDDSAQSVTVLHVGHRRDVYK